MCWLKLNSYGVAKGKPGLASARVVAKDLEGYWVVGFVVNLGAITSVKEELWVAFTTLQLA